MEDKLRAYMDHLFREVPPTKKAVEIKEEILQNLVDKYHDLLTEGKTEEAAYNIAIASVGDIDELLKSLKTEKTNSSVSEEEVMREKQRSAKFTACAVMLYICSVIPLIICDEFGFSDGLGAVLFFVFVAVATGLIIYNNMTKKIYQKMDDTMAEDFREWKHNNDAQRQAMKAIKSALWSIVVLAYFIVSFLTGAWYITWVIFLLGGAVESIIKAVFQLHK